LTSNGTGKVKVGVSSSVVAPLASSDGDVDGDVEKNGVLIRRALVPLPPD
jgi:hypothetical protein